MPATMGTADALLKEVYEPKVQRLLNDDVPLVQRIDRSSNGVQHDHGAIGGRFVKFALHVSRNTGIGARKEMEDLPTPGNQGYIYATEYLRYLYGSIQLSGQVIRLAASNTEAFLNVANDETTRLAQDLAVDLNRQLYGDGTGKLGVTSTVGASLTAQLTSVGGIWPDALKFQIGEYVDVFTTAAFAANVAGTPTAPKGSAKVTAINTATGVITFDTSITYANLDVFTRNGSVAREVYGLATLVGDTGILHGIDPSSQPLWKSYVDANGGTNRPISEGMILNAVHTAQTRGSKIDLLLFGLGVSRAYQNLLSQQRMNVNTNEVKGGTSGMAFVTTKGGIEMEEDWTAPPFTMYGLNTKELTFYDDGPWSWWNEDGSMWQRVYGANGIGKDAKAAFMYRYLQFVTHKRNAHFVLKDLIEG